tara:strand:- start:1026 stop:1658 length:633 start_codon:yes stop_codon:yes gene_type:complete
MISKRINKKGILIKLLEKCVKILIINECKKIKNIKVGIISSANQIIKGKIQKISIIAEDINYKDILFDEFELEANDLEINFKLINKKLNFRNDPIVKFKILLSQSSLKTILFSNNWNFIVNLISKEILNQCILEDLNIKNDQLLIKAYNEKINPNYINKIEIKTYKGKIYLKNISNSRTILLPIEEKVYIEKINIENNIINIFGNSSISF